MPGEFRVDGTLPDVYAPLARDLSASPEKVTAFFPRPSASPQAWRERAAELADLWAEPEARARRAHVVTTLTAWHEDLGCHAAQRRNLEALAAEDALVVVTGQQPGLLGGPLFCLYKALGAVRMAAAASAVLGRPVVPVFWVASEDHDWSEVSRARLAGPGGEVVSLRLPGAGDFRSAGTIQVPPEARHMVGELEAIFPPTPAGAPFAAMLRGSLQGTGRLTLAGWFTAQWQALLGARGLLFYDPMLPGLRSAAAPIFAGAAEHSAAASEAIRDMGVRVRAAGYTPGLDLEPDHVHLFVYHQGRRLSLHREGGRIRTKGGEVDLSPAELGHRAALDPAGFSPNVALRPIVQDFTLPVLAQLGGPGEVAYLAQLGPVFALWGRRAPLVAMRPGCTLLLPEDQAALGTAGVSVAELRQDAVAAIERAAAAGSPADLDAALAGARATVDAAYVALGRELAPISPHMPEIVRGNAERVRYQLDYLERKARQHRRRAQGELVTGLRAANGRLFPGGGPQERSSLAWPYLYRWGTRFLDALADALGSPASFGQHHLLTWRDAP